jgi:hypothetical protein
MTSCEEFEGMQILTFLISFLMAIYLLLDFLE